MARDGKKPTGNGNWTPDEKVKLRDVVAEKKIEIARRQALQNPSGQPPRNANGTHTEISLPWTEIALEHGTRSAKQCRERWDNHEKWSKYQRRPISPEEGQQIMAFVGDRLNTKWADLGRILDRPENSVKNFYYQEVKKRASRQKSATAQHVDLQRERHQQRHHRISSANLSARQLPHPYAQLPPLYSQRPLPDLQSAAFGYQTIHSGHHTALHHRQQATQQSPVQEYSRQHDVYQRDSFQALVDSHSRRPSLASDTPSLTSDHDSFAAADSPRSTQDGSWPPQQRLPDPRFSLRCLEKHDGSPPVTPRHDSYPSYPYGYEREQERTFRGASLPEYDRGYQGARQPAVYDASYERTTRENHGVYEHRYSTQHGPVPSTALPMSTHDHSNRSSDAHYYAPAPAAHRVHRDYAPERTSEHLSALPFRSMQREPREPSAHSNKSHQPAQKTSLGGKCSINFLVD